MDSDTKEPEVKPWWEQEWFLEWLRLAKRDYHGVKSTTVQFGY